MMIRRIHLKGKGFLLLGRYSEINDYPLTQLFSTSTNRSLPKYLNLICYFLSSLMDINELDLYQDEIKINIYYTILIWPIVLHSYLQVIAFPGNNFIRILSRRRFIWSAKVSNAYFSVEILTLTTLTLVLHMLTLVC